MFAVAAREESSTKTRTDLVMTTSPTQPRSTFGKSPKNLLVRLAGLLALAQIVSAVIGLYSLDSLSQRHLTQLSKDRAVLSAVELARNTQVHFKKQVQEWKNVLLRGANPTDRANYWKAFEKEEGEFRADLSQLKTSLEQLGVPNARIAPLLENHEQLGKTYRAAVEKFRSDIPASAFEADAAVRGIDRKATDEMDLIVAEIKTAAERFAGEANQQEKDFYASSRRAAMISAIVGIALVFAVLIAAFRQGSSR
jgi:methyl-accepting chemotaxis protein